MNMTQKNLFREGEVLFTKEECEFIKNGIQDSPAGTSSDDIHRRYEEFLILDVKILDLIFEKIKKYGVKKIKEGRVLCYKKGCFFNMHTDAYVGKTHRYKTVLIQLSDENDYEGGELIIENKIMDKKIGTTVMIDATVLHGMKVLKNGVRFSFVIWLDREDMGLKNMETNKII